MRIHLIEFQAIAEWRYGWVVSCNSLRTRLGAVSGICLIFDSSLSCCTALSVIARHQELLLDAFVVSQVKRAHWFTNAVCYLC